MDRPSSDFQSSDIPSSWNLSKQSQRNRDTRDAWDRFEPHRTRITQLLDERAGAGGRSLGILGAGNCNDLDLAQLVKRFREIHLFDWDAAALAGGLNSQKLANQATVSPHGNVELSGIAELLARWPSQQAPRDDEVETAIQMAERAIAPMPAESLDVVASVCLVSQLFESVASALSASHPRYLELIATIRRRHLGMMIEVLRPGGEGLLVTDVVSSETAPRLGELAAADVPAALARHIQNHNFFTGLNPAVLLNLLEHDSELAGRVGALKPIAPWLWDLGPRTYIVFAIGFQRALSPGGAQF